MALSKNWLISALVLVMGIGLAGVVERSRAAVNQAKEDAKDADPASVQLEAIGGLSAVNAQHTYLLIGVLSDAYVKGVYEGKQVRTMAGGVVQQLATVSDMLEKVQDGELSDEDDEYVDKIVEIYGLLQDQAKALAKYTEDPGEAEGKAFEKFRKASLEAIEKLLGANKPAGEEKGD
jgi:hypothetical protein